MVLKRAFLLIEVLVAVALFSVLSTLILKFEHLCLQTKAMALTKGDALNLNVTTIEKLKAGISVNTKNNKKRYEFCVNFLPLPQNEFKDFRMAKVEVKPCFLFTKHKVELVSAC